MYYYTDYLQNDKCDFVHNQIRTRRKDDPVRKLYRI